MRFRDHQERARRLTFWLLLWFAVAIAGMVAALYVVVWLCAVFAGGTPSHHWIYAITGAVLVIVGVGSALQMAWLRDGGSAVASRLGGRLLDPGTVDAHERRLLNVTEEMAIAAGVPVPAVHVLDEEHGINAFAAGLSLDDAAIAVSRGALTHLTRAELQGVVAHEVSHILNGDMRLNTRLMGALHGIEVMGEVGGRLAELGSRRGSRSREVSAFALLGVAVWLVGSVGYLAGQRIRAAVCRQCEFFADASAVQFTRNPLGLAGALRKVGAGNLGSGLASSRAVEVSHLLFADGLPGFLGALGRTHPPLEERIRRLDPSFDGEFQARVEPLGLAQVEAGARGSVSMLAASEPGQVACSDAWLDHAQRLLNELPAGLRERCRTPVGAQAVTFGLLLGPAPAARRARLVWLQHESEAELAFEVDAIAAEVASLGLRHRLPLLELCLPALRGLSLPQADLLVTRVATLVGMDGHVDVFEWSLSLILRRHLYAKHDLREAKSRLPLWQAACILFSFVAHAGASNDVEAHDAFEAGARVAGLSGAKLLSRDACPLADLDRAVAALSRTLPARRRAIVSGLSVSILADGKIGVREAEVYRAVAEALGCVAHPMEG